jgi:hypothetical protein
MQRLLCAFGLVCAGTVGCAPETHPRSARDRAVRDRFYTPECSRFDRRPRHCAGVDAHQDAPPAASGGTVRLARVARFFNSGAGR